MTQSNLQFHVDVKLQGPLHEMDEHQKHIENIAALAEQHIRRENIPSNTGAVITRYYTHFEAPRPIDAMIMGFGMFGPKGDAVRIIEIVVSEQTAPLGN